MHGAPWRWQSPRPQDTKGGRVSRDALLHILPDKSCSGMLHPLMQASQCLSLLASEEQQKGGCVKYFPDGGLSPWSLRPKIRQGFPPWGQNLRTLVLVCCMNHHVWLRPTSWRIHPWMGAVWWGWGRGASFRTTGIRSSSCTTLGIPARLPEAAWQVNVL